MNTPKLYGFYSHKQAELCGTSLYSSPTGEKVISCVGTDSAKCSEWDDEKPLGEVTDWIKTLSEGNQYRPHLDFGTFGAKYFNPIARFQ